MLVLLALQAALDCAQIHGAAHIAAVAGRICVRDWHGKQRRLWLLHDLREKAGMLCSSQAYIICYGQSNGSIQQEMGDQISKQTLRRGSCSTVRASRRKALLSLLLKATGRLMQQNMQTCTMALTALRRQLTGKPCCSADTPACTAMHSVEHNAGGSLGVFSLV